MIILLGMAIFVLAFTSVKIESGDNFISPMDLAFSMDGSMLATTDFTGGSVVLFNHDRELILKVGELDRPFGLLWLSETKIAVSEYGSHRIAIIDVEKGSVVKQISCVEYPMGMAMAEPSMLLVAGFGRSEVGVLDLHKEKEIKRIPVHYQPDFITVTPDGRSAFVSNLTPKSVSTGPKVSKIDLDKLILEEDIELLFGSSNVRQIKCSPDGRWVYVAHTYGKVMLPTTQLERGWITTNVLSIIDAQKAELYATIPFDQTTRGAADPWGIEFSPDGEYLYATLSGVDELAVLHLGKLHSYLSGEKSPENLRTSDAGAVIASDIWKKIEEDPSSRLMLADQLSALYAAGLLERISLPVKGPRGIARSPVDGSVVISGYFSGDLAWMNIRKPYAAAILGLGKQPAMTPARHGEMIFHDGKGTLQSWLSCVSCHPAGRADGLNWDLMNDGIGNPKNAKSLLHSHATPPSMSTGIRADYTVATKSGFHFIKFTQEDESNIKAVQAYLRSMTPDASPYLVDGALSRSAKRGKKLFESQELGCIRCHSGVYFTDQQMHDVGTRGKYDRTDAFDTPSLIEVWRTAPYLHDGSITDLEDLFTKKENTTHWHGRTKDLGEDDIIHLVNYVKSL